MRPPWAGLLFTGLLCNARAAPAKGGAQPWRKLGSAVDILLLEVDPNNAVQLQKVKGLGFRELHNRGRGEQRVRLLISNRRSGAQLQQNKNKGQKNKDYIRTIAKQEVKAARSVHDKKEAGHEVDEVAKIDVPTAHPEDLISESDLARLEDDGDEAENRLVLDLQKNAQGSKVSAEESANLELDTLDMELRQARDGRAKDRTSRGAGKKPESAAIDFFQQKSIDQATGKNIFTSLFGGDSSTSTSSESRSTASSKKTTLADAFSALDEAVVMDDLNAVVAKDKTTSSSIDEIKEAPGPDVDVRHEEPRRTATMEKHQKAPVVAERATAALVVKASQVVQKAGKAATGGKQMKKRNVVQEEEQPSLVSLYNQLPIDGMNKDAFSPRNDQDISLSTSHDPAVEQQQVFDFVLPYPHFAVERVQDAGKSYLLLVSMKDNVLKQQGVQDVDQLKIKAVKVDAVREALTAATKALAQKSKNERAEVEVTTTTSTSDESFLSLVLGEEKSNEGENVATTTRKKKTSNVKRKAEKTHLITHLSNSKKKTKPVVPPGEQAAAAAPLSSIIDQYFKATSTATASSAGTSSTSSSSTSSTAISSDAKGSSTEDEDSQMESKLFHEVSGTTTAQGDAAIAAGNFGTKTALERDVEDWLDVQPASTSSSWNTRRTTPSSVAGNRKAASSKLDKWSSLKAKFAAAKVQHEDQQEITTQAQVLTPSAVKKTRPTSTRPNTTTKKKPDPLNTYFLNKDKNLAATSDDDSTSTSASSHQSHEDSNMIRAQIEQEQGIHSTADEKLRQYEKQQPVRSTAAFSSRRVSPLAAAHYAVPASATMSPASTSDQERHVPISHYAPLPRRPLVNVKPLEGKQKENLDHLFETASGKVSTTTDETKLKDHVIQEEDQESGGESVVKSESKSINGVAVSKSASTTVASTSSSSGSEQGDEDEDATSAILHPVETLVKKVEKEEKKVVKVSATAAKTSPTPTPVSKKTPEEAPKQEHRHSPQVQIPTEVTKKATAPATSSSTTSPIVQHLEDKDKLQAQAQVLVTSPPAPTSTTSTKSSSSSWDGILQNEKTVQKEERAEKASASLDADVVDKRSSSSSPLGIIQAAKTRNSTNKPDLVLLHADETGRSSGTRDTSSTKTQTKGAKIDLQADLKLLDGLNAKNGNYRGASVAYTSSRRASTQLVKTSTSSRTKSRSTGTGTQLSSNSASATQQAHVTRGRLSRLAESLFGDEGKPQHGALDAWLAPPNSSALDASTKDKEQPASSSTSSTPSSSSSATAASSAASSSLADARQQMALAEREALGGESSKTVVAEHELESYLTEENGKDREENENTAKGTSDHLHSSRSKQESLLEEGQEQSSSASSADQFEKLDADRIFDAVSRAQLLKDDSKKDWNTSSMVNKQKLVPVEEKSAVADAGRVASSTEKKDSSWLDIKQAWTPPEERKEEPHKNVYLKFLQN